MSDFFSPGITVALALFAAISLAVLALALAWDCPTGIRNPAGRSLRGPCKTEYDATASDRAAGVYQG